MSTNVRYSELESSLHDTEIHTAPPDSPSAQSDDDLSSDEQDNLVEFEGDVLFVDATDWRESTLLKLQLLSSCSVFILFGLAESTVGTVIAKIQEQYQINDIEVSLIFLSSVLGYFIMALSSEVTHNSMGIRGVLVFGSCSMSLGYLIISTKPWFPLLLFCYVLGGIGCGSLDSSLNTWMGNLTDSNQLLGILHGCYGLGCMISPPLITALIDRKVNPLAWNQYYIFLAALAAVLVASLIITFRYESAAKYRYMLDVGHRNEMKANLNCELSSLDSETQEASETSSSANHRTENTFDDGEEIKAAPLSETLRSPLVWSFALVLFVYVGSETSFGGWLITFLLRIKKLEYKQSSYIASSFWFGLTLGRIVLGFVTATYFKNELTANSFYIVCSFLGSLTFWILSYSDWIPLYFVCVFVTGIFVGPVFPTTIVCCLKALPVKFHASGIGFICAFGGGAAGLPFLVGVIAELSGSGLGSYPLIVTTMFGILVVIWTVTYQKQKHTYGGLVQ